MSSKNSKNTPKNQLHRGDLHALPSHVVINLDPESKFATSIHTSKTRAHDLVLDGVLRINGDKNSNIST